MAARVEVVGRGCVEEVTGEMLAGDREGAEGGKEVQVPSWWGVCAAGGCVSCSLISCAFSF